MKAFHGSELDVLVRVRAEEVESLVSMLQEAGISCSVCGDFEEMLRRAALGTGTLLISAECYRDEATAPLEGWIAQQASWSDIPVLVVADPQFDSDEAQGWIEILRNVTLLLRPVPRAALVAGVRSALRARTWQYQIRSRSDEFAGALVALHHSETRLALATEVGGLATWDLDIRSGKLMWSDRHYELFGYPAPAVAEPVDPGMWSERLHPQDRARVLAQVAKSRRDGSPFQKAYRIIRAGDDAVRWITPLGHFEYDAAGAPMRFLGVFYDSTNVRKDEQLLHERTLLLEAIANATSEMIFVKDRAGRLAMANPSFCDLVGPYAEVIGKTELEIHPNADHAREIIANDERIMASNVGEVNEEQYGPADASITVLATKTPLRDESGKVIGLIGISRDITERKRMEESLRRSERLYRSIGDSIDYGIWISDPAGRIEYVSDSFLRMLGLSGEEGALQSAIKSKIHPDDLSETTASWERSLRTGAVWDREHRFLGADGKYHHVLSRGVGIREADGTIASRVGINLDIDRQKTAEHSLIEANARKDEFLATLAHELRNPLAPIRTAVKLMRAKKADDPEINWSYDVVERQVKQLARLVDDLLDISRITRGHIALTLKPVALDEVVESAIETSLPHIKSSGLDLQVDLSPQLIIIRADPLRLAQALSNLLNNAAKYTLAGGSVKLSARISEGEVVIRVRDTGIGISPEMLPRVFDLFMQKGAAIEPSHSGLGIGLTLVRRFVELQGGTVEGYSEGLGKGSEFVIRLPQFKLPLAEADTTLPEGQPAAFDADITEIGIDDLPYAPLAGMEAKADRRVLIVDDNEDNATSLAMLLTLLDYDVRTAHDGLQAVDLTASFDPAVVLMDIGLPLLDGYSAARRIRSFPGGESRTLIAVTGWGREEDRQRSQEAGYDHHLVKPISFDALRKILETASERSGRTIAQGGLSNNA